MKSLRYWLYRFKYLYAQHLNLEAPVDVSMELSSVCNMRCEYCYHANQETLPFRKGNMTLDTARLIIDDAAQNGVSSLKFNWKGEGTLNPYYPEIAKYAYDQGCFVERIVNSNFKIPPNKRERIFEALSYMTKVKVSYDSFRPEVFNKQRAGGYHALTTENIDLFYTHAGRIQRGTELVIQAVRTRLNEDEDIVGEVKKRWPTATVSVRDMVGGRVDNDTSHLESRARGEERRQSCLQAHARIIFNHAGAAFPCCPDVKEELEIGHIWEQSLQSIFNSQKAQTLRSQLKDGSAFRMNPCKSCSSFETYEGYKKNWKS